MEKYLCVHREQQHQRMSQFIYLRIAIYVGTHVPTILSHCVPTEPVMHFPACGGWMAGWLGRSYVGWSVEWGMEKESRVSWHPRSLNGFESGEWTGGAKGGSG